VEDRVTVRDMGGFLASRLRGNEQTMSLVSMFIGFSDYLKGKSKCW
jgi:hypothetical protein